MKQEPKSLFIIQNLTLIKVMIDICRFIYQEQVKFDTGTTYPVRVRGDEFIFQEQI